MNTQTFVNHSVKCDIATACAPLPVLSVNEILDCLGERMYKLASLLKATANNVSGSIPEDGSSSKPSICSVVDKLSAITGLLNDAEYSTERIAMAIGGVR